ncbi:phage scaffolding protein [Carnobacterium maltaromaticum]|uniref:phage scaffolding protein n=1 Tax=Carnobacterium maltaromaticum TaxID=2751 RepID=UPI0039BDAA8C
MKREQLRDLGLTDEQLGSVMALHGQTVNGLNTSLATAEQERDQFKEQLNTNQTELDGLKELAKGNKEVTTQLTELQSKFDQVKTDSETKLAAQKKDFAIQLALKEANSVDEAIVLGLLDKDTIKVTDDGLQGLKEQLETLKEGKPFLFQDSTSAEKAIPNIVPTGNPTDNQKTSVGPQPEKLNEFRITK